MAELNSLLPILTRADGMSRDNSSSFGALGVMLVKGVLGYILLRLGRSQDGLEVGICQSRFYSFYVRYESLVTLTRRMWPVTRYLLCATSYMNPDSTHAVS